MKNRSTTSCAPSTRLKRKYNIDETKIYLTGISDGGTGVYYLALKEPNLLSAFLPLNGSLAVLRNPDNGADGEMHGNNLVNAPLYMWSTARTISCIPLRRSSRTSRG